MSTGAQLGYLVAAICFILALKGLSAPKTARYGNWAGAAGATIAVIIFNLVVDVAYAFLDPRIRPS